MKWRWWIALVLLAGALVAQAADKETARKLVESSMVVTGTIDITADGSVKTYALDKPEKLPEAVVQVIGNNVPKWRFRPVGTPDGVTQAKMSLRLVAKKLLEDQFLVSIRSAGFTDLDEVAEKTFERKRFVPPKFPSKAAHMGANGVVYLLLRVGRDGRVEDAIAEQVNLKVLGTEEQMVQARKLLADSALKAIKRWVYVPPTKGRYAGRPYWVIRMPIEYKFWGQGSPAYGEWTSYIPGPRQKPSWAGNQSDVAFSPDALPEDGIYMANEGPQLLTPLGKS